MIILVIFIILSIVIIPFVVIKFFLPNKPELSIRYFNANNNLSTECKILKRHIQQLLPGKPYLFIIQDDIEFFDKNFYWPKNCSFVYLSDINKLAEKYKQYLLENKHSDELDHELCYFINLKVVTS